MLDSPIPLADSALLEAKEGKTGRDFVLPIFYNYSDGILQAEAFELRLRKRPPEPQYIQIRGFAPGTFLLELLP
jgi:hypothetical protein